MSIDVHDTEVVALDVGAERLELEQVRNLDELARASVTAGIAGPYWAYLWPSARALAKVIGTGPDLSNLQVLDLGCGPGALGVAACTRGGHVTVADIRPEAVALAQRNATRNGFQVEARALDWDHAPEDLGHFDRIFAADVFYEDGMLRGVLRFIKDHLAQDGLALIADPVRVVPAGVLGASRLRGLEARSFVLSVGQTMTRGVNLYELRHRVSVFANRGPC